MIKKIDMSMLLLAVFRVVFLTTVAGFGLAAGLIGVIECIKINDIGACVVPAIVVIMMVTLIAVCSEASIDEYNQFTHNEADEG